MVAALLALLALPAAPQTSTPYRAVLQSPGGDLPFRLDCVEWSPVAIRNGIERIPLRAKPSASAAGPAWSVELPPYGARLRCEKVDARDGVTTALSGDWRRVGPTGEVSMAWQARPFAWVDDPRDAQRRVLAPLFPLAGEPLAIAGRWRVQFASDPTPAVAIFAAAGDDQLPGEIVGTFLTVTGDYRFLAGTARGEDLRLACFDGAHAFLFAAKLLADGSLRGHFWSGASWHETWTATRDDEAALPDAFTHNTVRADGKLAALSYPAPDGTPHRLGDLLGKATLVYLFGTWCPNCNDAGALVSELAKRYHDRGLAVVGLCFEHGDDAARIAGVVQAYRTAHAIDWPILVAGASDKAKASAAFPILDRVLAYPTMLFVAGDGTVRATYTGFAGPAAPAEHATMRASFTALVERLLAEAGRGK